MRQSVEHLGPQHAIEDVFVASDLAFRICPSFEARRFAFIEPILKKYARVYTPSPFPYNSYPLGSESGRCYDQAMALASARSFGLDYVEGCLIAQTPSGPVYMPHAWCSTPSGTIVDPTAPSIQRRAEITYVGIPIKFDYAMWWKMNAGFHGLLDGHPELGDTVGVYRDMPHLWLRESFLPRWHHGG